ncbi:hypothetical protein WG66_009631, partial [Moniliophthora roreri]
PCTKKKFPSPLFHVKRRTWSRLSPNHLTEGQQPSSSLSPFTASSHLSIHVSLFPIQSRIKHRQHL